VFDSLATCWYRSTYRWPGDRLATMVLMALAVIVVFPATAVADQGGIHRTLLPGTYHAELQVSKYGSCSLGGEDQVKRTFTVEMQTDDEGFRFEIKGKRVESVYRVQGYWTGLNTAQVTIKKVSSCKGITENHNSISTAFVQEGGLVIDAYVMTWCERMGCYFREAWILTPTTPQTPQSEPSPN
jgi:hypothetical protein